MNKRASLIKKILLIFIGIFCFSMDADAIVCKYRLRPLSYNGRPDEITVTTNDLNSDLSIKYRDYYYNYSFADYEKVSELKLRRPHGATFSAGSPNEDNSEALIIQHYYINYTATIPNASTGSNTKLITCLDKAECCPDLYYDFSYHTDTGYVPERPYDVESTIILTNNPDYDVPDVGDWRRSRSEMQAPDEGPVATDTDESCDAIIGNALARKIEKLMTWLRIVVPILIIILGMVDFAKAVLINEKDDTNKAFLTFTKRCIAGVLVFLLPTLITVIVTIYNGIADRNPGMNRLTNIKDCIEEK